MFSDTAPKPRFRVRGALEKSVERESPPAEFGGARRTSGAFCFPQMLSRPTAPGVSWHPRGACRGQQYRVPPGLRAHTLCAGRGPHALCCVRSGAGSWGHAPWSRALTQTAWSRVLGGSGHSGTGTRPGVQAASLRDVRPGGVCEPGQLGHGCLVQVQNVTAEGGPGAGEERAVRNCDSGFPGPPREGRDEFRVTLPERWRLGAWTL